MASSRLKRKAADDDTLQSNNLNESFVRYGTPLPSLASTKKDKGEYVPLWQQEVRDEQGRRRLHGAFTGGFSAGYFNTVGSKEGWQPSTFVSSKDAKGKKRAEQRAEDFMDEEDLAELKASRSFQTSQTYGGGQQRPSDAFAGLGSSTPLASGNDAKDANYSAAVANSLQDLIKPGSSRIGARIMSKMGWREGQGVGPRVSFARRQEQLRELGHTEELEDDEDEHEEAKKHNYAPVDRPLILFSNKSDQYGLGFVAGIGLNEQLQREQPSASAVPANSRLLKPSTGGDAMGVSDKRMPSGGAFGISALEDADEEDDDIYSTGLRNMTTTISMEEDDDDFGHIAASRKRPELLKPGVKNSSRNLGGPSTNARVARSTQVFSDGTPLPSGFVLSDKPQPPDAWFQPCSVPKGWTPNPKAVWERDCLRDISAATASASNIPQPQRKGQQNMLSADDRAQMLGEPTAPKSVFDFFSAKNRERLKTASATSPVTSKLEGVLVTNSATPVEKERDVLEVPAIDPRVAQNALKGFMPYGDDPAKQSRYKSFVQHHAMPQDTSRPYRPAPLPGKTLGDLNIELRAFAEAAMIFKPMTGMMANRFTSGSTTSTLLDIGAPNAGLRKPAPKPVVAPVAPGEKDAAEEKRQNERDASDPRRIAVRQGNFGFLTRTVDPWYPARLLCKRLNVADPHPEGPPTDTAGQTARGKSNGHAADREALNEETMQDIISHRDSKAFSETSTVNILEAASAEPTSRPNDEAVNPPSLASVGLGEDETQGRDILTYEKPSMDIFKAIFADSEDEDEEAEEEPQSASIQTSASAALEDPSALPDTSIFNKKAEIEVVTMDSIGSFKPSFVSRKDRATGSNGDRKKEKKKKKLAAAVVSFDVDDGEEMPTVTKASKSIDKQSKKRKAEDNVSDRKKATTHRVNAEEEDDEWVEKEVNVATIAKPSIVESKPARARMRASELF